MNLGCLSRKENACISWGCGELPSLEELAWVALSQGGWGRRFSKETELGQTSPEASSRFSQFMRMPVRQKETLDGDNNSKSALGPEPEPWAFSPDL